MAAAFGATLVFLLGIGAPIFAALILSVFGFLLATTSTPPELVIQRVFSGLDKFPLMAIPFFILAGNLMAAGGMSARLMTLARALTAWLPGGMALTAVTGSMFFSAISGSSPATVVAMGRLVQPEMQRAGYARPFSVGLIMGSGSLGIIIPPSIFMIVYGSVTGVSIGALFLAAVGAGLLYALAFMAVCVGYALVMGVPREPMVSRSELAEALRKAAWAIAIPFLILGGIYGGIFTPTEAAAVAVAYAIAVTLLVERELDLRGFYRVLVDSAVTTAQVMIIVAAAAAFAWFLTTSGVGRAVSGGLDGLGGSPLAALLAVNVIVLLAGMVLDPNSIIIILVPILAAFATAAGVDPIHLGVAICVNAAIGMFTPPFGLNLFVASSLPGVSYTDAVLGALPFILVALVALAAVTLLPQISLWLPAQIYAGV